MKIIIGKKVPLKRIVHNFNTEDEMCLKEFNSEKSGQLDYVKTQMIHSPSVSLILTSIAYLSLHNLKSLKVPCAWELVCCLGTNNNNKCF